MFSGPKIETKGLKLHIDPSNVVNDSIRSIGRLTQLQNVNLDDSVDSTKKSKTASLNGSNSKLYFDEITVTNDWSISISFRTNISTSSPNFNQVLFGNNSNSPGIVEIGNDILDSNIRTYVSISYIISGQKVVYKSYISPFLTRYTSYITQDSYWLNNSIMLSITFKETQDGGIYKIYIDGDLKDTIDLTDFSSINSFTTNQIGGQDDLKLFSGDIFISSVYDNTLDDNDIKELFNAFKSRFNKVLKRRFFIIRSLWYNNYDNGDYEVYEKFNVDKTFNVNEVLLLESKYQTFEEFGLNPNRGSSLVDIIINEKGEIILSDFKEEKSTGKPRTFKKNKDYYLNIVKKHIN
jgi:hypothetical protein